ncbi:MAG: hypothetical protein NC213_09155 [Acetobacter sp.]|nr:hypothetical protein [Bacteroides sp.]MCM1341897.1 hypothetical protein [Acetobacter sp.]MCM1434081.1 hypothetical protein [Clostridiales bacterium]
MKKSIIIILCIILNLLILCSCSVQNNSETSDTQTSNLQSSTNKSEEQTSKPVSELTEKMGISKILFNIYNEKNELEITEELIGYIKDAENTQDIILDDSLIEIGKCYIVYSNEDTEKEFGTVYTDISNHFYLSAKSNKEYVVRIDTSSSDTVSGYDKLKSTYEKYEALKSN